MGQWHYKLADLGRASRRIASILFSEPPKGSFEEAQYFFEKSLQYNPNYIGALVDGKNSELIEKRGLLLPQ
mgnify:CR=1 FL=1